MEKCLQDTAGLNSQARRWCSSLVIQTQSVAIQSN